jgi:hypothetical protein
LSHQTVLAGWLHRHTAFTASKVVRSEHRRRAREEEVVRMTLLPEGEPADDRWQQVELVEQLRAENQLLAAVHMDAGEAERLRRDNAELHRLRGEVALRETKPRLSPGGLWSRAYGFADGHSEMRTDPTGDFSAWEAERLPTPTSRDPAQPLQSCTWRPAIPSK